MVCNAYKHNCRRKVLPAEVPELVGLVPGHLLDAVAEPLRAEEPPDGDRLEETDPEQAHAGGRVEVHQLEEVCASLHRHRGSEGKEDDADQSGELLSPRAEESERTRSSSRTISIRSSPTCSKRTEETLET